MDGNILLGGAQDRDRGALDAPLSFCTGFGQADTHSLEITGSDGGRKRNDHPSAGMDYQTITPKDLVRLVENPGRSDKSKAQWIIPSTYAGADARTHSVQRERGAYWFLPLDVDDGNLSREEVDGAIVAVCGDINRAIYSTRSARPDNRKWRAFVALSAPVKGADYSDTLKAFNELLGEASGGQLVADGALCRPGQLIYLPNRGDFYEHIIARDRPPLIFSLEHPIIRRRELRRSEAAETAREAAEAMAARKAQPGANGGIVDAFNSAHDIADLMLKYGYTPEEALGGINWQSPYQKSGSFATQDRGDYWVSLSGSDASAGLGVASAAGHRFGDAFDLYTHFVHGGDFRAAVRTYAAEIGLDHATQRQNMDPADYFKPVPSSEGDSSAPDADRPKRLLPVLNFEAAADAALTESAQPLVKGLLDEGAFSVFYGPSNSGKTFVVLDLAYSISTGQDWGGMKTTKTAVLYIAAEGGGGIKKRIAALRQRPGASIPEDFYLSAATIDLRRPEGDVTAVIDTARSIGRVGLIVIDTLSRALAGGDETKDMGALVVNIDKIRHATGAHVLLVHHSGKDITRGARGSSELRGAIDTEINIESGVIKVTKQRDLEFGEDISFEIRGVPIGFDADGDVVSSATVSLQAARREKPRAPTAKEVEVLAIAQDLLSEPGGPALTARTVAQRYKSKGEQMTPDTARKHLQSLADKHFLRSEGRGRWALVPGKIAENGPKSGNSTSEKTTDAIPAYGFAAEQVEIHLEGSVFQ